jgi:hypothetical protein
MTDSTAATIKDSVLEAELERMPIPADDVISGNPESSWKLLWRSADGKFFNGIWACTPGVFTLHHPGETIAVYEGRATLTPEGGEPLEIGPGDIAYVPEGVDVRWEIHETIRKAFHSHDSSGSLLGPETKGE